MCFHCSRVGEQFASHHFSRHLPLHMAMWGFRAAALWAKPISWSSRFTVHLVLLLPETVWKDENCSHSLIGLILWVCVVYHFVSELSLLLIYGRAIYTFDKCFARRKCNSHAMFSIHASVKDFGLVYGNQTLSSCYSDCPIVSCKKIWRYLQHNKVLQVCKMKGKVLRMTFAVRDRSFLLSDTYQYCQTPHHKSGFTAVWAGSSRADILWTCNVDILWQHHV